MFENKLKTAEYCETEDPEWCGHIQAISEHTKAEKAIETMCQAPSMKEGCPAMCGECVN